MREFLLAEQTHAFVREQPWQAAVLPFGATEPHNLRMPYGADTLQVEELGRRAGERGAAVRPGRKCSTDCGWHTLQNGGTKMGAKFTVCSDPRQIRAADFKREDQFVPDSIPSLPPVVSSGIPERVDGDFIGALYALDAAGDSHRAAERIVDYLDDLLNAGQFVECNQVLRQVDVEKLSAPLVVAFLGITRVAAERLPARVEFCSNARARLTADIGAERAERLLQAYT